MLLRGHLIAQGVEGIVVVAPHARTLEVLDALRIGVPVVTLHSAGRELGRTLPVGAVHTADNPGLDGIHRIGLVVVAPEPCTPRPGAVV